MKGETQFKDLVIQFLFGNMDETEAERLRAYIANDSDKRRSFDKLNAFYCMVEAGLGELSLREKKWDKISSKLKLNRNVKNHSVFVFNKWKFCAVAAAASVVSLLLICAASYKLFNGKDATALTTVSTNEGEKANICLPDSSKVIINSGSSFSYGADYNAKERLVALRGEAFFDIRTNRDKPFVVKLDDVTIIATGTKFNILSYKDDNRIETTLEEGNVNVIIKNHNAVELKPGQQIVFLKKTEEVIVHDVTTEAYTSWKENKLRFIETPLNEALKKIARRYNVTFEVPDADILDLKYTATFINETIDEVMQILKTVSPINYKIYNQTAAIENKYAVPKIVITKRNN
jgi:ferric-dicitrate binding protein FerR (iron transport regulator)